MTLHLYYKTKKELKNNVGSRLFYSETSLFGKQYTSNGDVIGCDPARKWFAEITIKNDIIEKVK